MRTTFIKKLTELAKNDNKIILITPDMGFSVFEEFISLFPDRFINVGISEQNSISVAAGLALSGMKPYVYSIVPFVTMRCFEQIRVDVAYMNTNVKIVGVGGGLAYGPAGATHHAIEDIAIMRALPNMNVYAPCDPFEAKAIISQTYNNPNPAYIRLSKNNEPKIHNETTKVNISHCTKIVKGNDFTIISYGPIISVALDWIKKWDNENVHPSLYSMHTIKPLDYNFLNTLIADAKPIIVLEEHNKIGGLGDAVASYLAKKNATNKIQCIGINDVYSHYIGDQAYLWNKFELSKTPNLSKLGL